MADESNPPEAAESFEAEPLFKPGELREVNDRITGAVRRHSHLALATFLLIVAGTALAISLLPRSYHVEARLLALPQEGAPGAARQPGNDLSGLVEGAAKVVISHERLRTIIRDYNLMEDWDANRGPLLRARERLEQELRLGPPLDPVRRERRMLARLEKKLTVQVKGSEVVIVFDWPNPATAAAVVSALQHKLVEARREAELTPLERRVTSLQASAAQAERRMDNLTERVTSMIRSKRRGARAASVRALQSEGHFRRLPDPSLATARLDLISRRKEIADIEDARRKRLSDLNATLAEQRATLGPSNAALLDTEEKIRELQADGSQLQLLKSEEQDRLAQYIRAGGRETELSADPPAMWPVELKEDDPAIMFEKARIAREDAALGRLRTEIEEARQAVAGARATFASRYTILSPPEIPEDPAFPNVPLLLFASALAGALAAVIGAVARDVLGNPKREEVRGAELLPKAAGA
ncbi:MAG TPA: hypothetical protein VG496_17960 [Myxococcales bacterium]|nr:hypothetical protein [Myxococcales bacterium]